MLFKSAIYCRIVKWRYVTSWNFDALPVIFEFAKTASICRDHNAGSACQKGEIRTNGSTLLITGNSVNLVFGIKYFPAGLGWG